MGCDSGMTCWRRLRDWQKAGVWEKMLLVILQHLHDAKKIDWSRARACIDFSVVFADFFPSFSDSTKNRAYYSIAARSE